MAHATHPLSGIGPTSAVIGKEVGLAFASRRCRLKVNLGSGNEPLAGYINVDRRRVPGVAVVADVRRLPFASSSVEQVNLSSLLEHFADPYRYFVVYGGRGRMMAGRATRGRLPGADVLRAPLPAVAAAGAFSEVNKVPLGTRVEILVPGGLPLRISSP